MAPVLASAISRDYGRDRRRQKDRHRRDGDLQRPIHVADSFPEVGTEQNNVPHSVTIVVRDLVRRRHPVFPPITPELSEHLRTLAD